MYQNFRIFVILHFESSFGELTPVVRDAVMYYYECYKIPDPGQYHLTRTEENEKQLFCMANKERGKLFLMC